MSCWDDFGSSLHYVLCFWYWSIHFEGRIIAHAGCFMSNLSISRCEFSLWIGVCQCNCVFCIITNEFLVWICELKIYASFDFFNSRAC